MMNINNTLYLQAEVANEYMRQHNLTPQEFVELDKKHNILHFLEVGYESFHLTGTQGVIEEIEDYIRQLRIATQSRLP
jgi:L-rhamnose mutarotase